MKSREPLRYCDKARTAALIREWQRQDAEAAANRTTGTVVSPDVLEMLEQVAAWKRAQPAEAVGLDSVRKAAVDAEQEPET
jgi:hypothetical protein